MRTKIEYKVRVEIFNLLCPVNTQYHLPCNWLIILKGNTIYFRLVAMLLLYLNCVSIMQINRLYKY